MLLHNTTLNRFEDPISLVNRALRFGWPAILLVVFGCSSSDEGSTRNGDTALTGPVPTLPAAPADCPVLQTGTVNIMGKDVLLWVGEKRTDKKGPVLFYWHGSGGTAEEIQAFMQPQIDEIVAEGGIAASFTSTTATGTNLTGNNIWHTGDYDLADVIVACAVQQLNIDTRRIYTAGCSAGGLASGSMVLARSSYLAGAMPNSGGNYFVAEFQDPTHIPAVITAHGAYDVDVIIVRFADMSMLLDQKVADSGGVAVDCDHGGGHCAPPTELVAAQWQFLKDHPFGINPDPYANGLPSTFPTYCRQIAAQHDQ